MRNRTKQITGFVLFVGASALVGCASVQTTHEYANAHGYRPIEIQGTQYFCHRETAEVPGSPLSGVSCLTRSELTAKVVALNNARLGLEGPQLPFNGPYNNPPAIAPGPDIFARGTGPTIYVPPR
jgi:hypothetical protein